MPVKSQVNGNGQWPDRCHRPNQFDDKSTNLGSVIVIEIFKGFNSSINLKNQKLWEFHLRFLLIILNVLFHQRSRISYCLNIWDGFKGGLSGCAPPACIFINNFIYFFIIRFSENYDLSPPPTKSLKPPLLYIYLIYYTIINKLLFFI